MLNDITTKQQPVPSAATQPLQKFTPDEIFQQIDKLRSGFEPAPTLVEQLLSAGKRDYARAIEDAKISAIKARKDLINGLGTCVKIYVDAHAGDLKVRAVEFVTETFDRIMLHLESVSDEVIAAYYDLYMDFVDEIKRKKLPPDIEDEALKSAFVRLQTRQSRSDASIGKILDNLTNEVIRFSQEVGR